MVKQRGYVCKGAERLEDNNEFAASRRNHKTRTLLGRFDFTSDMSEGFHGFSKDYQHFDVRISWTMHWCDHGSDDDYRHGGAWSMD